MEKTRNNHVFIAIAGFLAVVMMFTVLLGTGSKALASENDAADPVPESLLDIPMSEETASALKQDPVPESLLDIPMSEETASALRQEPDPESLDDIPMSEITAGGVKYKLDNKAYTATVVGYEEKSLKEINIPATLKVFKRTYKVTAIANNALKGLRNLTKATVGKNVTKIGKNAFSECKKLKSVTMKGTKIIEIDKNAFKNIGGKATFKVPGKKLDAYRKMIKNAGAPKDVSCNTL